MCRGHDPAGQRPGARPRLTMTHKQLGFYLSLFALVAVFLAFWGVLRAHAASNVIAISQGVNTSTQSLANGHNIQYNIFVGDGLIGSTTGAVVTAQNNGTHDAINVGMVAFPDPTYTNGSSVSTCVWSNAIGQTSVDGFSQLASSTVTAGGADACIFNPDFFYEIVVIFDNSPGLVVSNFSGDATNTKPWTVTTAGTDAPPSIVAIPQFAILTNGFTLTPNYGSLSTSTCTFSNITGCFQNALTWAFVPPAGSLDASGFLWNTLKNKPPFGYFTTTQAALSDLGATTTPAFALGQVDGINTYIFDPIDEALAAIWWAIVGIWFFFNRARHIDI